MIAMYFNRLILFCLWAYLARVLLFWRRKPMSVSEIHAAGNVSERSNLTFLLCALSFNSFIMTGEPIHLLIALLSIAPLRSERTALSSTTKLVPQGTHTELFICFEVNSHVMTHLHQVIGAVYFVAAPVLFYIRTGRIAILAIELFGFIAAVALIEKKFYPAAVLFESLLMTFMAIAREY